jgi:hypothetical protein
MSEYNLPSIFEQITTGSRVPENGKPIRVPGSWEREPAVVRVLGFLGTGNPLRFQASGYPKTGFRVPRNGEPTVYFAFPGS